MNVPWLLMLVGVAFGFALSRIGFSSWDEVHRMFSFADLRLTLTFACAVLILAGAWIVMKRRLAPVTPRRIHPGTLAGGLLFGMGWALCGACPSIALVQLGEGQLGALATLSGIFVGNWFYAVVHQRFFRWPTTNCLEQ